MPHPIAELLVRNLHEVFGENDAQRRRAALDELYTDDCVLYVPDGEFAGRGAVDQFAGELRSTHPEFVYTPRGRPEVLHDSGILAWGSGRRGEAPEYTGLDVILTARGRIKALYVYLNPMLA